MKSISRLVFRKRFFAVSALLTLPVCVGVDAQTVATPQNPETVGLRLGMSFDDAVAVIKKRHGGAPGQFGEVLYKGVPPVPIVFFYQSERDTEVLHVDFAGPPSPRTVTRIHRAEYYNQGSEPNFQETVKAILAKYGPPTTSRPDVGLFTWFYGQGGLLRTPPANAARCVPGPADRKVTFYANELSSPPGNPSAVFLENCGTVMDIQVGPATNPQLVQTLAVVLIDHRAGLAARNLTQEHVIQAGDRLRDSEANAAKAKTPSL